METFFIELEIFLNISGGQSPLFLSDGMTNCWCFAHRGIMRGHEEQAYVRIEQSSGNQLPVQLRGRMRTGI